MHHGITINTITVVASSEAKSYFEDMRTSGIEMLGRTVFPLGHSTYATVNRHSLFPRNVNVKFLNLPYICQDDDVTTLMELPPNIELTDAIERKTELIDGIEFYTGEAIAKVAIHNENELKALTRWSYDQRMKNQPTVWNSIPICFHAPSLHVCEECKKNKRRFQGHHKDWCFLAKKERLDKMAKMTTSGKVSVEKPKDVIESVSKETIMEGNLNETQDDLFNDSTVNDVDTSQDANENAKVCSSRENKDENFEPTKQTFEDATNHPRETNATLSKYDRIRNKQRNKRQSQSSTESTNERNKKKAAKASSSPKKWKN